MSLTLGSGETIQGKASAGSALVITVWGVENAQFLSYILLARVTLTTSPTTIYSPASGAVGGSAIVKKIVVQSIHASDQTVELWVNGSTDAHRFYKGVVKAGGANHPIEGVRLNADGTPLSYELNPGSGGGGGAVPVQEGGTPVVTTPTALNFTAGFDVSDVGGVATVDLDEGELDFSAATLSPSGLVLPGATSPAQTAEGSAVWDTNDDRLTIGDGAARKTFLPSDTQFVQGTHATRIAAAHVAGRLYRETDTGLIYYDDGTNWLTWMADGSIRKTANETVNNVGTPQNDDDLKWPVEINENWFFEVFLLLTGVSTTADWKFGLSVPASATASWDVGATGGAWSQVGVGTTPGAAKAASAVPAVGGGNLTSLGYMAGWVFVAGTAGTVNLQWSQNTPTVENNVVLANSLLRIRRLA